MKQNHGKFGAAALIVTSIWILQMTACSRMPWKQESDKEIAKSGPTVLNAHSEPGTFELNNQQQAKQPGKVLADVKDFNSKIIEVKLNFTEIPLSVTMHNIGGTTWVAELSSEQLRSLAVPGKTMKYKSSVVAKDEQGKTASSKDHVEIEIIAPAVT